jgi:homoserine kinase
LSGAGPSVLVVVDGEQSLAPAEGAIRGVLSSPEQAELVLCRFQQEGVSRIAGVGGN